MGANQCSTCNRTESSRWYKDKTQCASCSKKEWYAKNKDKALKKSKDWQDRNKNTKKKINAKWYIENREHRLKKNAMFKKQNSDYHREYRVNNREQHNAYAAKYRATKLNATLDGYDSEIELIYKSCPIDHEVHHIIPLQEFSDKVCGLHVPWNLEILTKEEHLKAHEELRKEHSHGSGSKREETSNK